MKYFFLALSISLIPFFAYADIAGPVLTKIQACEEKDGASMNRLQIIVNEKKSDTLYFYKNDSSLYYIVPMSPYTIKHDWYNITYSASLFLYQYYCKSKKSKLLNAQNLKKLLLKDTVFTPSTPFDSSLVREFNYGQVNQVTNSEILFEIGITQTGIKWAYSFELKTRKFQNQIFIDSDWSLKNYKSYNKIYSNEGDWSGVNVYYKGKIVRHFASCNRWWTKYQSDIDDFCGSTIQFISVSNEWIVLSLLYSYPGAPLDNGKYMLKPDGSMKKLTQ